MKKTRLLGITICTLLLAGIFMGAFIQPVAAMTDEGANTYQLTEIKQQQTKENIRLSSRYPVLSGSATTQFSYDVEIAYEGGTEAKYFDLKIKGSDRFFYSLTQSYGGDTDIVTVKLEPRGLGETLRLRATPNIFSLPDPGEYTITLEVSSGNLVKTIDLKAVVTAKYGMTIDTTGGILSTQITADKDNFFTIRVYNSGTATLDNINITTSVRGSPSNWQVTAEPAEIGSLAAKAEKEVKINIRPPAKTISGDYEVTITAKTEAATASSDATIRVTVLTQTIWGWVGVGIIVIVVAGLIVMFIYLGRR